MADRRYADEARARELRVVVVMTQVYTLRVGRVAGKACTLHNACHSEPGAKPGEEPASGVTVTLLRIVIPTGASRARREWEAEWRDLLLTPANLGPQESSSGW